MKTCSQCKKENPLDAFYPRKRGGVDGRCKDCRRANARADHYAHREEKLARMKKRHKANREAELAAMRQRNPIYYQANRDKFLARHQENRGQELSRMRSARVDMRDCYLRWLICQGSNLKPADIPQGLIDAKREHLRILRELKKENYEKC